MRYRHFAETPLFMALLLWVCTLPVLLLTAPRFVGWTVTWYLVGAVLVAELVACWVLCRFPAAGENYGLPRGDRR